MLSGSSTYVIQQNEYALALLTVDFLTGSEKLTILLFGLKQKEPNRINRVGIVGSRTWTDYNQEALAG